MCLSSYSVTSMVLGTLSLSWTFSETPWGGLTLTLWLINGAILLLAVVSLSFAAYRDQKELQCASQTFDGCALTLTAAGIISQQHTAVDSDMAIGTPNGNANLPILLPYGK